MSIRPFGSARFEGPFPEAPRPSSSAPAHLRKLAVDHGFFKMRPGAAQDLQISPINGLASHPVHAKALMSSEDAADMLDIEENHA